MFPEADNIFQKVSEEIEIKNEIAIPYLEMIAAEREGGVSQGSAIYS